MIYGQTLLATCKMIIHDHTNVNVNNLITLNMQLCFLECNYFLSFIYLICVFCTSSPPYSWDQSAHTHTHWTFGESFAAGEQAVRQEMKCLIRERMRTRRAWAEPGPLLTCPSRGEARKQGRDGRKGWGSRAGGGGRWGGKWRPSWGVGEGRYRERERGERGAPQGQHLSLQRKDGRALICVIPLM